MPEAILIVDDDPAIGAALTARLEANGYSVELAACGLDGLEAARSFRPSLVLLDVRLPDIDGFEVCRRLKADAETAAIPVVFITANAVGPVQDQAMQAGGSAFLKKPYEAGDVLATIQTLTGPRASAHHNAENGHAS